MKKDQETIRKIKSGNNEAFSELYRSLHNEFVWLILRKFPRYNQEDADALFNDACMSFYENITSEKLTPEKLTSSIKTYLFQIGINKALAKLKKNQRIDFIDDYRGNEEELLSSNFDDEYEIELQQVEKCLISMGDPCRSVLHFFYYQKIRMVEIAEKMGYKTPDVAKNQKAKCIKKLRKIYREKLPNL
mgnify:CR=1 FL=1